MVRQVQLVSSFCLFCCLMFFSCKELKQSLRVISLDPNLDLTKNIVVYNNIPFSGLAFNLYPKSSDTLWSRYYKNGLKTGVWRKYFSSGDLKEARVFVKNKKEGDYYGYYKDGSKNFIFQFNKGEYHGTNKLWTKEGLLVEEGNFKAGYESGVQKTWYLNGKVKSNYIIKNNRRYGLLGTKNCVNVSDDLLLF